MMPALYFACLGLLFHAQSSLWESIFHEYYLDIRPASRFVRFRRIWWLSDLWFGSFGHGILHHYLTFRDTYTRQFAGRAQREALRRRLAASLTEAQARQAEKAQYGNSLTWSSARYFGLPVWLNLLWLLAAPGPAEAAAILAANLVFGTPYLLLSKYVHPFLHDEFRHALARAPAPVRLLLRSRYGLAIRVSHFVHHRHPTRNFNLQLGADIIRRRWLPPAEADWAEMARIGLIEPDHRAILLARPVLGHGFRA